MDENNLTKLEVDGIEEEQMEKSLRPKNLKEYIGQTKVKQRMKYI